MPDNAGPYSPIRTWTKIAAHYTYELNTGREGECAQIHLKQPTILPDSNKDGKPFVVSTSMLFVAGDVKFGIYTTVEISFDPVLANTQNAS
jgi:hypothetical protein